MSQQEYQKDLLTLIGKSEANISELAKATGHSRDYIRERYGPPPGGGAQNKLNLGRQRRPQKMGGGGEKILI